MFDASPRFCYARTLVGGWLLSGEVVFQRQSWIGRVTSKFMEQGYYIQAANLVILLDFKKVQCFSMFATQLWDLEIVPQRIGDSNVLPFMHVLLVIVSDILVKTPGSNVLVILVVAEWPYDDIRDREIWTVVAWCWYFKASDKGLTIGRLYHHLGILARPSTFQQHFSHSRHGILPDSGTSWRSLLSGSSRRFYWVSWRYRSSLSKRDDWGYEFVYWLAENVDAKNWLKSDLQFFSFRHSTLANRWHKNYNTTNSKSKIPPKPLRMWSTKWNVAKRAVEAALPVSRLQTA